MGESSKEDGTAADAIGIAAALNDSHYPKYVGVPYQAAAMQFGDHTFGVLRVYPVEHFMTEAVLLFSDPRQVEALKAICDDLIRLFHEELEELPKEWQ